LVILVLKNIDNNLTDNQVSNALSLRRTHLYYSGRHNQ